MRRLMLIAVCILITSCGINPTERNNAANWYAQNNQLDVAIQAYQVAQVNDPNNALLYLNSATAYETQGEVELAKVALQQAILRGDNTIKEMAFYNLGNLYFRQTQYNESVEAFKQALILNPNDNDARFNLELALQFATKPTPTPIEMQSNPEQGQADASATPSPIPANSLPPTATPTPPPDQPVGPTPEFAGETGDQVEDNRATPIADIQGEMSVEKAKEIFEETQHRQQNIGKLRTPDPIQTVTAIEKDW